MLGFLVKTALKIWQDYVFSLTLKHECDFLKHEMTGDIILHKDNFILEVTTTFAVIFYFLESREIKKKKYIECAHSIMFIELWKKILFTLFEKNIKKASFQLIIAVFRYECW